MTYGELTLRGHSSTSSRRNRIEVRFFYLSRDQKYRFIVIKSDNFQYLRVLRKYCKTFVTSIESVSETSTVAINISGISFK